MKEITIYVRHVGSADVHLERCSNGSILIDTNPRYGHVSRHYLRRLRGSGEVPQRNAAALELHRRQS